MGGITEESRCQLQSEIEDMQSSVYMIINLNIQKYILYLSWLFSEKHQNSITIGITFSKALGLVEIFYSRHLIKLY